MALVGNLPPHVHFKGVGKSYDNRTWAVRHLDLEVLRGEFLTLLGPSGSGKTTALMMLAGFEDTTEGEIRVDGQRIDLVPPNQRGIGMVFQNYALFPHMTVAENLAFPLEVRHVSKSEITTRVHRALDLVSLPGMEGRRPAQLSGGQQQRVAVARALIFEPQLVLMDEPLGALDKQLREQMQFELKDIHARLGVTFVYVTHDQTEALTMSDRIAVFNDGHVQQLSTPDQLYERPQTDFVANFIGENNRIEGVTDDVPDHDKYLSVVLKSGMNLVALYQGTVDFRKQMPIVVSIRPERIAVLSRGESLPIEFQATVIDRIYVGDHIRFILRTDDIEKLVVKTANVSSLSTIKTGDRIRVGWRKEDCLALKP